MINIDKVKELYAQKTSVRNIGKQLCCSGDNIKRLLELNGVHIRTRGEAQRNDIRDTEIAQDYLKGVNIDFLCEKYNFKPSQIYRILRRRNAVIDKTKLLEKNIDKEKIKELYAQKMSLSEIGGQFGWSKSKIKRVLKQEGVKIRSSGEAQRDDSRDTEIVQDYLKGVKVEFLCQRYDCGILKIYRVLKRNNIVVDRKKTLDDTDKNAILELYAKLKNVLQVSKIYDVSFDTVKRLLKKRGIEIIQYVNKGDEHWNWHGGTTPEREAKRKSTEYKLWRKKVYARDNFKCCICESKENINAHHIIAIYNDESKIFDLNNGITLCQKCHEKTYGKENEFIDYFKGLIEGRILDEEKFKDYFKEKALVEPILCACGCGQYTKITGGKSRKYIKSHRIKKIKIQENKRIRTSFTDELLLRIKEMYVNGKSCYEIHNELKVSSGGVANVIKKLGISRLPGEAQRLRFEKARLQTNNVTMG